MPAKPTGYWDDFATLERELLAFIDAHGTPGVMPTHRLLRRTRRHDLAFGIHVHGGTAAVGERLRLTHRGQRRPQKYWQDPENVEREVLAFVAEHGPPGVMPKKTALAAAGRINLSLAITRSGGHDAVARRLGLRTFVAGPAGAHADSGGAGGRRPLRSALRHPAARRFPSCGREVGVADGAAHKAAGTGFRVGSPQRRLTAQLKPEASRRTRERRQPAVTAQGGAQTARLAVHHEQLLDEIKQRLAGLDGDGQWRFAVGDGLCYTDNTASALPCDTLRRQQRALPWCVAGRGSRRRVGVA